MARETIWQATWLLAVIVASAVPAAAEATALAMGATAGSIDVKTFLASAALSTTYNLLYAGLSFSLLTSMIAAPTRTVRSMREAHVRIVWFIVCLMLLFPGLPILSYLLLPSRWSDLTWPIRLAMAFAAGVTVRSWRELSTKLFVPNQRFIHLEGPPPTETPRSMPGPGRDGWKIIAWFELRFLLGIGGVGLLLALSTAVAAHFVPSARLIDDLTRMVVHLFERDVRIEDLSLYCVGSWFLASTSTSQMLQPILRQLRAMPFARWQLAAANLGIPMIHVLLMWAALIGVNHLATHAWPASWRFELIAMSMGVAAFGQAVQLRLPSRGQPIGMLVSSAPFMLAYRAVSPTAEQFSVVVGLIGAVTFVTGVLVTLRCLDRGATYRVVHRGAFAMPENAGR